VWPTNKEIAVVVAASLSRDQFLKRYGEVFKGPKQWQAIEVEGDNATYRWSDGSTYVRNPPYFDGMTMEPAPVGDVIGARILAELGDSITTDHISPAGSIRKTSPAGDYLLERQVTQANFNSYGARRGNHEVMMRGTFANIRIRNEMLNNVEGGMTKHLPSGDVMPIYDAAMRYKKEGVPLVIFGGKEYGTGSSRDWAAKGTTGAEIIDIVGLHDIKPRMDLTLVIHRPNGTTDKVPVTCRIDTIDEVAYYLHGGILHYVLRGMAKAA
jgi:aconitate hydratase